MSARRRVGLLVVAGAVAVVAFAARPPVADAHAVFVGSRPADGESVPQAPSLLHVTFDEAVTLTGARAELRNGKGDVVAAIPPVGAGDTLALTFDDSSQSGVRHGAIAVTVPRLDDDVYQLRWRLVSADDLHPTNGALTFGIGQPAVAGGLTNQEPLPSYPVVVAGWLDLLAVAVLVGALGVRELLVPVAVRTMGGVHDDIASCAELVSLRAVRIARVAAGAAIATKLLVLGATAWAAAHLAGAAGIATAIGGQTGRPVFVVTFAGATGIVVVLRPDRGGGTPAPGSMRALTAVAFAVGLLAISAQGSHLAVQRAGSRVASLVLTVHLLAAGVWIGGLIVLGIVIHALRRGLGAPRAFADALMRAFRVPAAVAVGVLTVTGLHLTGRQVASVDAGLRSLYGHILGGKLLLVVVAGIVGLVTGRRVRGRGPGRPSNGLVALETGVGVVVLAAAAVLAVSPPARGARYETAHSAVAVPSVAGRAADLFVNAAVAPNQPGRAFVNLEVQDTRRPAPGLIVTVEVTVSGPGATPAATYRADRLDLTRWQAAGVTVAGAGTAHLVVTVTRAGLPDARFTHDWIVPAPTVTRPAQLISGRPLAPITDTLAVIGLAVGGGVLWRARRRTRRPVDTLGYSANEPLPPDGYDRTDDPQLVSSSSKEAP